LPRLCLDGQGIDSGVPLDCQHPKRSPAIHPHPGQNLLERFWIAPRGRPRCLWLSSHLGSLSRRTRRVRELLLQLLAVTWPIPSRPCGRGLMRPASRPGRIFRPINKAGTVGAARLTDRSVANIVKAYAARAGFDADTFSGHSRGRFPDIGSWQGRINLQDDGRFTAQVRGHFAGLRPRCRFVQGSRRGGAPLEARSRSQAGFPDCPGIHPAPHFAAPD